MANILVGDDEELARFTIREILEAEGHAVQDAVNGEEVISMQNEFHFDLVITDIIMPNKEGIQTILELKKQFPDLKIICVSGSGSSRNSDYLDKALKAGASFVLSKPFMKEDLLKAVEAAL